MPRRNPSRPPELRPNGTRVPGRLKQQALRRDDYRCVRCGHGSRDHTENLTARHVVSRDDGGRDTINNIIIVCRHCCLLMTARDDADQRQHSGQNAGQRHLAAV